MNNRRLILLILFVWLFSAPSFAGQPQQDSSSCATEYENHNQIDYGPLVVQEVKGMVVDPEQDPIREVCVSIFTEKDHKLVATGKSDADGKFNLQDIAPGRYRLIVKADPLCAANVPVRVIKHQKKKQTLKVHMKPRGLDACSYGEVVKVE